VDVDRLVTGPSFITNFSSHARIRVPDLPPETLIGNL
jgi:hypothetical protein